MISMPSPMGGGLKTLARDLVRRHVERTSRPFRILSNRSEYDARRRLARQLPAERGYDIAALNAHGYMRIEPATAEVHALVGASRRKLDEARSLPQRGNKPFFSQLLGPSDYSRNSVFLQFALDERLLTTIARYLRCAPFLNSAELLYSKPLQAGPMASQLWHRDRRDLAIIKVFVYATDVSHEHGPLTVLPLADSASVPDYLRHYLTDDEIACYAHVERAVALTGAAGTTWLVDSENCYHLGSRCEQPRLAYVAYYDSGFGYRRRETDWAGLDSVEGWTPLQRYALGLVAA
jgi:hypothetical protein